MACRGLGYAGSGLPGEVMVAHDGSPCVVKSEGLQSHVEDAELPRNQVLPCLLVDIEARIAQVLQGLDLLGGQRRGVYEGEACQAGVEKAEDPVGILRVNASTCPGPRQLLDGGDGGSPEVALGEEFLQRGFGVRLLW